MKNKEVKKIIEKIMERIDEIIDEKDLLRDFENECYEAQVASCDMDVSIVVDIHKETKEVLDVHLDSCPSGLYCFPQEDIYEFDVYNFSHKTWEDDAMWDYCIQNWKEEHNKEEDDDYDIDEVTKDYEEVYKQNFEYDWYRVYDLEEHLEYHLFKKDEY